MRLTSVIIAAWILLQTTVQAAPPTTSQPTEKPRLVVVIMIDQLCQDYLERFEAHLCPGGFKRLMQGGAYYTNCHHPHGVTMTGPGHATVSTGAPPAVHGIVHNEWHEFSGQGWREVTCVQDRSERLVGNNRPSFIGGVSAKRIVVETLSDAFHKHIPGSTVVTCSLKDTAANMLGGHASKNVYWFDDNSGRMITSSYYRKSLPDWVQSFNEVHHPRRFLGQTWERLLPASAYACCPDEAPAEGGTLYGFDRRFPHDITAHGHPKYRAVKCSPFGNTLLFDFSRAAIRSLKLGQKNSPDLLLVSLSSNDYVGHQYGPHSQEVMDITLRTDRQLASFLSFLDDHIGKGQYLLAITADHGVVPIPESLPEGELGGRFARKKFYKELQQRIRAACGRSPAGGDYVHAFYPPWLFLNDVIMTSSAHESQRECVASVTREFVQQIASVDSVYFAHEIGESSFTLQGDQALRQRIKLSYYPGRAAAAYVHLAKNWYGGGSITGHGTAHPYDTHVPLLFFGSGVKPGSHSADVSPTSIVPTICEVVGIPAPTGSVGSILLDALE